MDADEDLSGGGLWRGDFFEFEDFRAAEFVDNDRFHFMASAVMQILLATN